MPEILGKMMRECGDIKEVAVTSDKELIPSVNEKDFEAKRYDSDPFIYELMGDEENIIKTKITKLKEDFSWTLKEIEFNGYLISNLEKLLNLAKEINQLYKTYWETYYWRD